MISSKPFKIHYCSIYHCTNYLLNFSPFEIKIIHFLELTYLLINLMLVIPLVS